MTVADGGTVIFPPIQVGSSGTLNMSVQNTGTSTATISSVNIAAATTMFVLSQLPALPLDLAAGAVITFPVSFAPNTTGSLTTSLRINSNSFTLSGNGTPPPSLPTYQFQSPSPSPQAAQQPTIGLTLAAPYATPLRVRSSCLSSQPCLPTILRSSSPAAGAPSTFTIPANSTQALFNGSASIPLQTGTTAGTIVITPSFAMPGGFDLTPASPDLLTLSILRSAPALQSASITSQTARSFSVVLSGYSTTHGLSKVDVDVAPKQGQTFAVTHVTIDVSAAASSWFQSAASQGTGGSFLASIAFNLQNGSTTDDLVHLIQSLAVTVTNDAGTSNAFTVTMP